MAICPIMSHLNQLNESCPSPDMGGDAAKYQYRYPPPPGEEYEHARAYHPYTSLNSSARLPSTSYDSQSLQAGGYPQESRVNSQDSHTNAQQWSSDYGRDEVESWNGFQRMLFTPSAPRQRAAIACRYCRRRKVRHFSLLNSNMQSTFDFGFSIQAIRKKISSPMTSYPEKRWASSCLLYRSRKSLCSNQLTTAL